MIIKESVPVGNIYFHHTIYKIKSICFLNMGAVNQEVELCPCTKHGSTSSLESSSRSLNKKMGTRLFENSAFLYKTVGAVKNVSNTIKTTTQQAATQVILANMTGELLSYASNKYQPLICIVQDHTQL